VYVPATIAIFFLLLTVLVILYPLSSVDKRFSAEIQEHLNPTVDTLMIAVSWFGYMPNSAITVIAVAAVFFVFKYRKEGIYLLLTMLSGPIGSIVKYLVNRPRPSEPFVKVLGKNMQQSFPSGHVLFYVMFFGFLTLLMYRLTSLPKYLRIIVAAISLALIFIVPISRVYLGAHWFTDVLGGFLLGILGLYTLGYFYLKMPEQK
jgi:undecaprenyl-diphosphatase